MPIPMIESLIYDIKLHIDVDTTVVDKDFQEFWRSFLLLAEDALVRAQKRKEVLDELQKNSSPDAAAEAAARLADTACPQIRDADTGIVLSVARDIENLLDGKSVSELNDLEKQIRSKFEEEDIDVAYWEGILQKIPFFKVSPMKQDSSFTPVLPSSPVHMPVIQYTVIRLLSLSTCIYMYIPLYMYRCLSIRVVYTFDASVSRWICTSQMEKIVVRLFRFLLDRVFVREEG